MSLRRFFRRDQWDRERREELDSYLRIEMDENIARGMDRDSARAAALKKLGNPTLIREEIYRMNTITILDSLARDVRYAFRMLRHNPTFTAAALLTLAIGIGANTAVFSVVNGVLLKPLAYPHPEELVAVWQKAPGAPGLADVSGDLRLSSSMYFTYAENNRSFQGFGVWTPVTVSVTGLAEPEQAQAALVSTGTLEALNVQPLLGRWLSPQDQVPNGPARVMLNYGYWQRRFGGEPSVIGRSITVDSQSREIVGIMPAGFRFGDYEAEVILPTAFDRNRQILAGFGWQGIARLKPGVSLSQANADLARMVPIWMSSWSNGPGTNSRVYETWKITPALRLLKQDVIGNIANILWVVMGTIGLVMLIACANVANLLLVRADARQQELAVRAALGAGRARVIRELLVESGLLGLMGGVLGVAVAEGALQLLLAIGPANLPRLSEIAIDPSALAFTLVLSLLSGLLFGCVPALKYAGARISGGMSSSGRTLSHSRERHRTRNTLVVAQVALALVLLISAGLMIRTFWALQHIEPGFTHPQQLQTLRIAIPPDLIQDPERVARTQKELADKLAGIPGVRSVGFANTLPLGSPVGSSWWDAILAEGQSYPANEVPPLRVFKFVSPAFFQTMGTRLVAGRDFTWTDLYDRRFLAVVSENLARELWRDPSSAIGKRIRTGGGGRQPRWREVIGVVQDVRENGIQSPAPATVFWPSFGEDAYQPELLFVPRNVAFVIHSERAGTEPFLKEIQSAVWSVNANLTVASMQTMQEVYGRSLARTSFTLVMLAIAGAMALVLGIIGIYGVIAYAVSQRTREIGIRLALGAQGSELQRMFIGNGLALVSIGVVIGLAAAAGLTRLMRSLLFGISPLDPATYIAVPLILAAAAILASYLPARRAAAVDPIEALRAE